MDTDHLWALVLAGGDGIRLQALTRLIAGAPEAIERTFAARRIAPPWRAPVAATA